MAESKESKCFAFVFGMASGHINPSFPLARALVSQGHQVHYLSREQMRPAIEDTGATYWSEMEEEHELYDGRPADLMGCMAALKKEIGAEDDPLMVGYMKVGAWSLSMQLPGCIRWLQKIKPSAVVYCPMLNQDAGFASHVLQIPSVALLTTAGPGSMTATVQFFLGGQDPQEIIKMIKTCEPVQECIQKLEETYGFHLDLVSGLDTFGYLQILNKADLVMMTTTEDLQDPAPPELLERYEREGVKFVAVGPLLDRKGAQRAAGHRFEIEKAEVAKSGEATEGKAKKSGEILRAVQEAKDAGRKVIYASMGTVITGDSDEFGWHVKPQQAHGRQGITGKELCHAAFRALFDAFGEEKVDVSTPLVVLATGPQPDALENIDVPANALCVPEVPQVDLLRLGVDLFLTHFGQNSFMESLSLGVPMVGCPGLADQPTNAKKAEAMGVALQIDRPVPEDGEEQPAIEQYRKDVTVALRRVFEEPHFHQRAAEVSQGIKEAGGVPRATEILLEVAQMDKVKGKGALPKLLGSRGVLTEVTEKPVMEVAC